MNLSIQDELQRYVTPTFLEELAREFEFVKRKQKFSGSDLATICIWMSQRVASDPLVRLCSRLHAAIDTLRPGDLCIRDLSYFSLEDLD